MLVSGAEGLRTKIQFNRRSSMPYARSFRSRLRTVVEDGLTIVRDYGAGTKNPSSRVAAAVPARSRGMLHMPSSRESGEAYERCRPDTGRGTDR